MRSHEGNKSCIWIDQRNGDNPRFASSYSDPLRSSNYRNPPKILHIAHCVYPRRKDFGGMAFLDPLHEKNGLRNKS